MNSAADLTFNYFWDTLPADTGSDYFERQMLDLFLSQIRTWRVQFFGEHRTATTVLPPAPEHGSARVREIALKESGELSVSPHFELYSGLEGGEAHPVPLQVRLIGDAKAVATYKHSLNSVLTDVFPGTPSAVGGEKAPVVLYDSVISWTEQLRDFGRLHRESYLTYTLVVQLDEYWSFQRSEALRRERDYLLSPYGRDEGRAHDALDIFQPTTADRSGGGILRRIQQFSWNGYHRSGKDAVLTARELAAMDRVPFMWDFGFLLCNKNAWESASDEDLHIARDHYRLREVAGSKQFPELKVGEVLTALGRVESASAKPDLGRRDLDVSAAHPSLPISSWRFALEAASAVQAHHAMATRNEVLAFDLPVPGPESLSVLVLEIWASEVYRKYRKHPETAKLLPFFFQRFVKRCWLPTGTRGLVGLIAEPSEPGTLARMFAKALAKGELPTLSRHSIDLFKSLLLLREVLDLSSIVAPDKPFALQGRDVNPGAVCARHWYSTACGFFSDTAGAEAFVPVRLPGHFSVRGDWFLGVAKGSRSSLLADRALDLLSSRRGNLERLQAGLGLPVRDLGFGDVGLNPRTRIPIVDANGRRDWVRYHTLTALGANDSLPGREAELPSFNWLWRSTLGDYDAQARAFQKGILRLLDWWAGLRNVRGTQWKSGFHLFDVLEDYYNLDPNVDDDREKRRKLFDDNLAVNSLWEFPEILDSIVENLRRATPRRE